MMSAQVPFAITISRQLGSGGSYLGQRIAARLHIRYADREIIRQATAMLHASEEEEAEPTRRDATPVWHSLLRTFRYGEPVLRCIPSVVLPPLDSESHIAESSIVTQIAENWHSVIVGRGGYHLLRDNPRHLALFIHADADFRSSRIQEVYEVSPKEAVELIEASDRARRCFLHSTTGATWADVQQYHLSIDTSALGFALAEEMVLDSMLARLETVSTQL